MSGLDCARLGSLPGRMRCTLRLVKKHSCRLSGITHAAAPSSRHIIEVAPVSAPLPRADTAKVSAPPSLDAIANVSAEAAAKKLARERRRASRAREQLTYKVSAIAATLLFAGLAFGATYYRFFFHHESTTTFPWVEFWATIAMIGGGVVAMEMYARWAHRVLWHDFQPGWAVHASHHVARQGPFEANDIFAVINAVPAIALTAYGFFTPSLGGGLCFGFGMGLTVFGIMYMFVHDGLVHKRFPVGPIAEMPQLKRIAIAHRLHHSDKYGGVPYGMFLGPQELEAVGGGRELDRLVEEMRLSSAVEASKKQ